MRITLLFLCLLLLALPLCAQTVQFTWDPYSPPGDISGFKLYQSISSPVCSAGVPISGKSVNVATYSGGSAVTGSIPLPKPGTYFWTIVAVSPDGSIESDCSNEVSQKIKPRTPKLNAVQQVAQVIKAPFVMFAGLFKSNKGLRVTNQ